MALELKATPRFDWTIEEARVLHEMSFMELLWEAQKIHRENHEPGAVQLSQLVSIKTGGCPEDCGYCSQSAKFAKATGLKATKLMEVEAVISDAKRAKDGGATRYCMGAAWTGPKDRDLEKVGAMIRGVKSLGLETCATLGMVNESQALKLKEAGLDYYNHNIDTSERFYSEIISTRQFQDRLDTLGAVRKAGMAVCCGGILGMGEEADDRLAMLVTLAHLEPHPESVPINQLIPIPGTDMEGQEQIDSFEFIRTIAIARIMMPKSMVRLSAGRTEMSDEMQALCFMAGANSIFVSGKLLTADNPEASEDSALFQKLGLTPMSHGHG